MTQKRKYKNPYHQTQSELAEWLALFARDHSTTQVAEALVERYPERSTGDPKADHRLAKEAICTVNPNDSRYNAEKWAKQYRLMQANYITELDTCHRQLASKALTALNAAYDNLQSTLSSLSPKDQISLVPKALLTLSQAVEKIKAPLPPTLQIVPRDDIEEEGEAEPDAGMRALQLVEKLSAQVKAQNMLLDGMNFDEVTAETGVTEDELREVMERQRVEHEVLGMYEIGMDPDEIRRRTNHSHTYIDSIIDKAVSLKFFDFDGQKQHDPTIHDRTRALLKNGDGKHPNTYSNATKTQL